MASMLSRRQELPAMAGGPNRQSPAAIALPRPWGWVCRPLWGRRGWDARGVRGKGREWRTGRWSESRRSSWCWEGRLRGRRVFAGAGVLAARLRGRDEAED